MDKNRNPLIWFTIMVLSTLAVIMTAPILIIQIVYRIFSKDKDLWYFFQQVSLSNDNMLGTLWFGSMHTLSAITGKYAMWNNKTGLLLEKVIDRIFGKNHCKNEAMKEYDATELYKNSYTKHQ